MDKSKRKRSSGGSVQIDNLEEESLNELTARYIKLLRESEELDRKITEIKDRGINCDLKPQMQALHEYNEMKDSAQIVLGYLANIENITITELHQRYNLPME